MKEGILLPHNLTSLDDIVFLQKFESEMDKNFRMYNCTFDKLVGID